MAAGNFETAYGSNYDDTITAVGLSIRVVINGYDGNDLIYGGDGNDTLRGLNGDDIVYGGLGNDLLFGGFGADELYGQDGNDELRIQPSDVVTDGGLGTDLAYGREATAGLTIDLAASSFETAYGSNFDDTITAVGLSIPVVINGYDGNDVLTGGDGNDTLRGLDGDDIIYGGLGNDRLFGNAGADELYGQDGNDELRIQPSDVVTDGGEGTDLAYGLEATAGLTIDLAASSFETAYGSNYDDTITAVGLSIPVVINGYDGNDVLTGGDGNDTLRGLNGDDIVYGGAGNDLLYGNEGADELYGQDGNDQLRIQPSDVVTDGGEGTDLAYGLEATAGLTIDVAAGNFETVYGSNYDDTITAVGVNYPVVITGFDGSDNITVAPTASGETITVNASGPENISELILSLIHI